MSGQARVESVEALRKFRTALAKFAEIAGSSLDESEAEITRAKRWIQPEQESYWKSQLRKRTELYTRAKSALTRKKEMRSPLGGHYSCAEEEKALAVAERKVNEAQQKAESVRRWKQLLDDEARTYQTIAQGLGNMILADVPVALARLDGMIAALEQYAASTAPARQRSVATEPAPADVAAGPERSMARGTVPDEPAPDPQYASLIVRVPSADARAAAPAGELSSARPVSADAADARRVVQELAFVQSPCPPDDLVVLAPGVLGERRVFLARSAPARPGDSGWYVGPVTEEADRSSNCAGVSARTLLDAWPDLETILQLPAGALVVLDGVQVHAVYDPGGVRIWPAAASAGSTP